MPAGNSFVVVDDDAAVTFNDEAMAVDDNHGIIIVDDCDADATADRDRWFSCSQTRRTRTTTRMETQKYFPTDQ